MGLWPVDGFFKAPTVNDVANQVKGIGFVVLQKIEEVVCLATGCTQVHV
jgi:hypothetical protein